jgi:hypothetical protein
MMYSVNINDVHGKRKMYVPFNFCDILFSGVTIYIYEIWVYLDSASPPLLSLSHK